MEKLNSVYKLSISFNFCSLRCTGSYICDILALACLSDQTKTAAQFVKLLSHKLPRRRWASASTVSLSVSASGYMTYSFIQFSGCGNPIYTRASSISGNDSPTPLFHEDHLVFSLNIIYTFIASINEF